MGKDQNKSGLATASMVLGIIAIVGAWIPLLNVISLIIAVVALGLGIAPLIRKRGFGKALTGVILAGISIILFVAMYSSVNDDTNDAKVENGNQSQTQGEESADSGSEKTTFAINEAISFDGKEVTVTGVERNWDSGNEFITPESGKEYVKVSVTIKNSSNSQISYNTYDWKMKDSTGDIQSPDSVVYTVDGALSSGELAEGGTKTGFLVFEVPSGDTGLVLQYEPGFWSSKKLEINL